MSTVTLAATQFSCGEDRAENLDTAERAVREAARRGAQIVLVQELFETPYFCAAQEAAHFALATTVEDNPAVARCAALAAELGVVLPVSFFERAGRRVFNSVAVIDADGRRLGVYRKTHIPQGPGYEEKYYFAPGDTGFRVWDTAVGRIGVGICWDQWFPEAARAMALGGADVLLYPTAIGSEPQAPDLESSGHWRRCMQGHAAANMAVVAASNRVGRESEGPGLTFYGQSFVADGTGAEVAEMGEAEGFVCADVDLAALARARDDWGLFRDRRPEMYGAVTG